MSSAHGTKDIVAHDGTVLFEYLSPDDISLDIHMKNHRTYQDIPVDVFSKGEYQYSTTVRYSNHHLQRGGPLDYVENKLDKYKAYFAAEIGLRRLVHPKQLHMLRDIYIGDKAVTDPILNFGVSTYYTYLNQAVKPATEAVKQFWEYARDHYEDLPSFNRISDLMVFAITFSTTKDKADKAAIGRGIINTDNTVKLSRFLPRFLEQDEFETLEDFMENTVLEGYSLPIQRSAFTFIDSNSKNLSKKSIYREIVKMDRKSLLLLVESGYTFPASGTIEANFFDIKYGIQMDKTYKGRSHFMTDFSSSSTKIFQFFSENPHKELEEDFYKFYIETIPYTQHLTQPPSKYMHELMVPIWLAQIIESDTFSAEEVRGYLWFLLKSGEWAKSDNGPKYVIRRLFTEFDLEDILDIADSIIENKPFYTIGQWFKYLNNYENLKGLHITVALSLSQ